MSIGVRHNTSKPSASVFAKLNAAFFAELAKRIASVRIDRTWDIPYLGGYSTDGKTVFIDRRIPKQMRVSGVRFDPATFLVWHELSEKMLIDDGVDYPDAHWVANRVEKRKVTSAGIDWTKYEHVYDGYIDETEGETEKKIPRNLDLTPYKDEKDRKRLKVLRAMMRK